MLLVVCAFALLVVCASALLVVCASALLVVCASVLLIVLQCIARCTCVLSFGSGLCLSIAISCLPLHCKLCIPAV